MTGISNDEFKRKVRRKVRIVGNPWQTCNFQREMSKTLEKAVCVCVCVCLSVEHFMGNGFKVTALCSD